MKSNLWTNALFTVLALDNHANPLRKLNHSEGVGESMTNRKECTKLLAGPRFRVVIDFSGHDISVHILYAPSKKYPEIE